MDKGFKEIKDKFNAYDTRLAAVEEYVKEQLDARRLYEDPVDYHFDGAGGVGVETVVVSTEKSQEEENGQGKETEGEKEMEEVEKVIEAEKGAEEGHEETEKDQETATEEEEKEEDREEDKGEDKEENNEEDKEEDNEESAVGSLAMVVYEPQERGEEGGSDVSEGDAISLKRCTRLEKRGDKRVKVTRKRKTSSFSHEKEPEKKQSRRTAKGKNIVEAIEVHGNRDRKRNTKLLDSPYTEEKRQTRQKKQKGGN